MSESEPEAPPPTPAQLQSLAALVGVDLDAERAAALAPQAAQHLALLRAVAALDPHGAEPAAEFRLDAPWEASGA